MGLWVKGREPSRRRPWCTAIDVPGPTADEGSTGGPKHKSGEELEPFLVVEPTACRITQHSVSGDHSLQLVTASAAKIGMATPKPLTVRLTDLSLRSGWWDTEDRIWITYQLHRPPDASPIDAP